MFWQTVTHKKHIRFLALTVLLTSVFSWQCNFTGGSDGIFCLVSCVLPNRKTGRGCPALTFFLPNICSQCFISFNSLMQNMKSNKWNSSSVLEKDSTLSRGWRICVCNTHCRKSSLTHWQINLLNITKCTALWWAQLSCNRKQKLPF